ncbi:MAG: hypothetical protein KA248_09465 [Kiritimatiellae bacterium]|nr:hypothetical protein [Kiritimatiellia bacterium]
MKRAWKESVCSEVQADSRRGIALVVVLAILSVLVLLAVALSINVRTERLVAEYAKDGTRSQHFVQNALNRAVADLHGSMWSNRFADNSLEPLISVPLVYSVYESVARDSEEEAGGALGSSMPLIRGEVLDWIPRRYFVNPGFPELQASNIAKNAEWIAVIDPIPNLNGLKPILGRYAYVALDCTGPLDVHMVNRDAVRGGGTSVLNEINYKYLPEVTSIENLHTNLGFYHRFGTFPEILFLNDGIDNRSEYDEGSALSSTNLNNLQSYSLCYDRGWFDWESKQWKPADDIKDWVEADAKTAFEELGYLNASDMAQCFSDYIDTDFKPKALDIPCCEPVPMINEIQSAHQFQYLPATLELRYTHEVRVELWFPWAYTNVHDYEVTVKPPKFRGSDAGSAKIPVAVQRVNPVPPPPLIAEVVELLPQADNGASKAFTINGPWTLNRFVAVTARYEFVLSPVAPFVRAQANPQSIKSFSISLEDATDSHLVDNIDLPSKGIDPLPRPLLIPPAELDMTAVGALAVNDPRINHVEDGWDTPSEPTIGAMNKVESFNESVGGDVEGLPLYCRNNSIGSVAELGYIPTGIDPSTPDSAKRWNSIDLFSERGRQLLARYRCGPFGDDPSKGRFPQTWTNSTSSINPNTTYTNVLIAAFRDTPMLAYPGGPTNRTVENDMARVIVQGMWEINTNRNIATSNRFDSAAGWVTSRAFSVKGPLSDQDGVFRLTNNEKESLIANSYRIFNPNQNLFTIIVVAQTLTDRDTIGQWDGDDTDIITSERRAVALLWRDPFPGPNERHEAYIRIFRYLDDAED